MLPQTQSSADVKSPSLHAAFLVVLIILAFIGLVVSINLLNSYDTTRVSSLLSNEWFCGAHETLDYGCSGVFASRFGKPLGIPLPAFGAVYFAFILLWLLIFRRRALNPFFALTLAGGAAVSGGLLYVLFFILPGQCRWCLLTHSINGMIILLGTIAFIRYGGLLDFHHLGYKLARAFLVVFIILSAVGWFMTLVYHRTVDGMRAEYEDIRLSECYQRGLYTSQKARAIQIEADDHVLGDPKAAVTIVVYKDYQCPHCLEAWRYVKDIFTKVNAKNPNNVRIILRHFPLSTHCNTYMKGVIFAYACPAARAAEAAYLAGGNKAFWTYNDLLAKCHADLDQAPYLQLAEQAGLDCDKFRAALKDPRIKARIDRDTASLVQMGLRPVVPTIFINGRYVDGWNKDKGKFMETLVREELKASPVRTGLTAK